MDETKINALKGAQLTSQTVADLAALGVAMAGAATVEVRNPGRDQLNHLLPRDVAFCFPSQKQADEFIALVKKVAK